MLCLFAQVGLLKRYVVGATGVVLVAVQVICGMSARWAGDLRMLSADGADQSCWLCRQ